MTYREPKVEEYWLCLGDIHSGSEVAPMPPKVEVELMRGDERTITPNPAQKKFNAVWRGMMENLPKLTGVILNGDLCDGPNKKSAGQGAMDDGPQSAGGCVHRITQTAQGKDDTPEELLRDSGE